MRLLDANDDRAILRLNNGTILIVDDEGFTAKCLPGRDNQIKTTEWSDWLMLNDVLNKITRGSPIIRSG